ncbi:Protein of unknown function (DUF2781) [Geosmithia morbida]|uniref:Efficient mitochondria targeting-associated protein 19 n=1 Tax=Geosmithia morbida TaxID=1094350 RepID=A0A9P5D414_9HYPO|nr:Protein of unknown function (DUF2781) [Geosmithia morbida]KAF4123046.1 Protein of unknown function (DUF2781) [Geosmithia morbida]
MVLSRGTRDTVYLAIVGTQLFGMLVLDLVSLYPKSLWESPSAPLHFLTSLREAYVSMTGDPFFAASTHEPWFEAFLYLEAAVQLPLTAYLARSLSAARNAATTELSGLVYGTMTATTSAATCYHLWQLGEDVVSRQDKALILYGEYVPFVIIPLIMAIDMYQRLLVRLDSVPAPAKKQQ